MSNRQSNAIAQSHFHFFEKPGISGVCIEENKKLPEQKLFDGRKEFIRLHQNNSVTEFSDIQDMDSKGTNS